MTAKQFYDDLLSKINVPADDMEAARERRRELQKTLETNVGARIPGTDSFGAGALAQATQIKPLNDIDVVVRVPKPLSTWVANPRQAMLDVKSWIENDIPGIYELSTHAIKITFPDEEFTADIVVGWNQPKGILLPHCPKDEPHRWIAQPLTSGDLRLTGIGLLAGDTIRNILFNCSAAIQTITTLKVGVYDSAANLLASSANVTSNQPTGISSVALSTPYVVQADGFYYLALIVQATTPGNVGGAAAAVVGKEQTIGSGPKGALLQTAQSGLTSPCAGVETDQPIWLGWN